MPSLCSSPGAECQCRNGTWVCASIGDGCPDRVPNLGQPCVVDNLVCNYVGTPCRPYYCKCGVWGAIQFTCE